MIYETGVFADSDNFANACENPRSGAAFDDFQGNELAEKYWLRSWSHETYLWYDEITDLTPDNTLDKFDYFDLLKTEALTPSGAPRDQFHFTRSTEEYQQFSQSGVSFGYGAELLFVRNTPPRQLYVAYVEPLSPAANAGMLRGMRIMEIDGIDLVSTNSSTDIAALNAALSPDTDGELHTFGVLASGDPDTGIYPQLVIAAADITSSPVLVTDRKVTSTGQVGYIAFNDHIATAEAALVEAIADMADNAVTDLVLDLRYNGGGYLAIASQLAYMIAGNAKTSGRIFETLQFNDKHPTINPVTQQSITPNPFYTQTLGFSLSSGAALPSLELNRVFIISGSRTCSASESIINSLNGIGVQVILIGSTTCGKPYGFYPQDNCGTTYFSIQFQGVNDIGFGDYADGFTPINSGETGTSLPGCSVLDDLSRDLGDVTEARFAAALAYRDAPGTCPTPPPVSSSGAISIGASDQLSLQIDSQNSFYRNNRLLGVPGETL
jgi:C-terminal processing protease CtpA/Prc